MSFVVPKHFWGDLVDIEQNPFDPNRVQLTAILPREGIVVLSNYKTSLSSFHN